MGKDKHKHKHSKEEKMEEKRKRKREEKLREKEEKTLAKLTETADEKRARRLAKKEAKRARTDAQNNMGGYTNEDNPWNDANLTEAFQWHKKVDRDVNEFGMDPRRAEVNERKRRKELQVELAKVKEARERREVEREAEEEQRRVMEREREQLTYMEWEEKEDKFHLGQSKLRAMIRVKEGRGKAIDQLSKNLNMNDNFDPTIEIDLQEPYKIFTGLTTREIDELKKDVETQIQLDEANRSFWQAMNIIANAEYDRQEARESGRDRGMGGVHNSVGEDIENMLKSKTAAELDALQAQVQDKLDSGDTMDTEYWDAVLKQSVVWGAKAKVTEVHQRLLEQRLTMLRTGAFDKKGQDGNIFEKSTKSAMEASKAAGEDEDANEGGFSPELIPHADGEPGKEDDNEFMVPEDEAEWVQEDSLRKSLAPSGERGMYSPELIQVYDDALVVEPDDDKRAMEAQRSRVLAQVAKAMRAKRGSEGVGSTAQPGPSSGEPGDQSMVDKEAGKGMEQGEAQFSFEVNLEQKSLWWHDKFRPRKPRYFNRVHTGYEWNKYNQTHYDHDNPPPKMVQGYKFNIFYPDIIDRSDAPTYQLVPDPSGAKDTCLLKFSAGAPYEDIAFKIVNREWEHSHKKGFKCRFERGILQLYFNFKRYRYRR